MDSGKSPAVWLQPGFLEKKTHPVNSQPQDAYRQDGYEKKLFRGEPGHAMNHLQRRHRMGL
jgi:hypothetical protein